MPRIIVDKVSKVEGNLYQGRVNFEDTPYGSVVVRRQFVRFVGFLNQVSASRHSTKVEGLYSNEAEDSKPWERTVTVNNVPEDKQKDVSEILIRKGYTRPIKF